MTATICCDHAGADALGRAHQRAAASGTELRLVVTAQIVWRVRSISGLDRLVSIYPSLEAATAARPPALVIPLAAARPDGPAAAVYPAVVWKLVDALRDGVALADGGGRLALANMRLEEMFGYGHDELIGRPVETHVPCPRRSSTIRTSRAFLRAPSKRPAASANTGRWRQAADAGCARRSMERSTRCPDTCTTAHTTLTRPSTASWHAPVVTFIDAPGARAQRIEVLRPATAV